MPLFRSTAFDAARQHDEQELARRVQERTYPKHIPSVPGYRVFGKTVPASWSNGDFYDAIGVKPREQANGFILDHREQVEHLVLTLGDATGHGMAAALMATELKAMLRASIRLGVYHRDLVEAANAQLNEDLDDGCFITLFMGRLVGAQHLFRWVSFGQAPIWIYRARTDVIETCAAHHPPLGMLPSILGYQPTETFFDPGDSLLLLSDGFAETMNTTKDLIGDEPILAVFRAVAEEPPEAIFSALWNCVERHADGVAQRDDRTFLMIRRDPL
jgi:sigma-B regulation protein RsbU (phosphoserine phosphatase)